MDPAVSLTRLPSHLPASLRRLQPVAMIGYGAYAQVVEVCDSSNGERYALKVVEKQPLVARGMLQQLAREFGVQREVNHPNIVRAVEMREDQSHAYLLLELCVGGSVWQATHSFPSSIVKESIAAHWLRDAARGIAHLHSKGLLHRDLKLENLLIDASGVVHLCDFGWCAFEADQARGMCGTPQLAPPEVRRGEKQTPKIDAWALGACLVQLLTGRAITGPHDATLNVQTGNHSNPARMLARALLVHEPLRRVDVEAALEYQFLRNADSDPLPPEWASPQDITAAFLSKMSSTEDAQGAADGTAAADADAAADGAVDGSETSAAGVIGTVTAVRSSSASQSPATQSPPVLHTPQAPNGGPSSRTSPSRSPRPSPQSGRAGQTTRTSQSPRSNLRSPRSTQSPRPREAITAGSVSASKTPDGRSASIQAGRRQLGAPERRKSAPDGGPRSSQGGDGGATETLSGPRARTRSGGSDVLTAAGDEGYTQATGTQAAAQEPADSGEVTDEVNQNTSAAEPDNGCEDSSTEAPSVAPTGTEAQTIWRQSTATALQSRAEIRQHAAELHEAAADALRLAAEVVDCCRAINSSLAPLASRTPQRSCRLERLFAERRANASASVATSPVPDKAAPLGKAPNPESDANLSSANPCGRLADNGRKVHPSSLPRAQVRTSS
eukprot:gnl/TRDRNA2_/TRDRNA2_35753_c0_seq1.p1 gnl/TRDRNA2_/TRDRNA2_35753_c0~~gnl/TRDRNA2_/TRDRNA2_35753_c0_seq1.p1  ORF type:complete len:680 (+),score=89.57 gnl/TRDRNA2_/TRDRNA2_35753_c0_seq1:33-2042(+)